ncbi:hypothetical protein TNCV_1800381 [Trichonephila clavipes]|nr:hypothetical protein TNCV_1800381 [Trichonephila clavipes]
MQWLLCVLTWNRGRPNGTVMVVNVTMKRAMSCSILEKAHFANASLCAVSAGKSSWHDCNLYGYSWRIRRRILRTDDGGKPNHLAASRALWAVGSLVVRASDSRPEGLGSMLDVTKYPPSAHGVRAR